MRHHAQKAHSFDADRHLLPANLRRMISSGARPILLGLGVWVAVAVSSLLVQLVIGRL